MAQRRLRSAWAPAQSDQSSLCAKWVAKDHSFLHADSEDSDQTGRMPRLIWVFCWAHMPFCWFCHDAAHFILLRYESDDNYESRSVFFLICQAYLIWNFNVRMHYIIQKLLTVSVIGIFKSNFLRWNTMHLYILFLKHICVKMTTCVYLELIFRLNIICRIWKLKFIRHRKWEWRMQTESPPPFHGLAHAY